MPARVERWWFETGFVSPQPFLPDLGDVEWRLALRIQRDRPRRKRYRRGQAGAVVPGGAGA